ncbi:AraC family transcriptional regulator [Mesorhizobium plurifarium]|uniref:AraC family transcriptional regulator n=1 Tax=Mesorhizobium plurifarium TaxID=69974 RepID=A0A0K2VTI5_MESPL|nr:AraC family transcriptional regulator [Mesorhizobium plurifarium]
MNIHNNQRFTSPRISAVDPGGEEQLGLAILILPGFSHLALGAFIEPLSLTNAMAEREVFRWQVLSPDGKFVSSRSGITVATQGDIAELTRSDFHHLVIIAGHTFDSRHYPQINSALRSFARRNIKITAIGTATWFLAQAGLLTDTLCTIHWSQIAAFAETFRDANVCNALFVRDGKISTCAGEVAAFDLALDLVTRYAGADIIKEVCRYTTVVNRRSGRERQTSPAGLAFASANRKLATALHLMEDNIEVPLDLAQLAKLCKSSIRQLERLFMEHVGTSPAKHYKQIRLEHARRLVEGTGLSLTEVAIACGFASASHFTKCFKELYGATPNRCR